MKAITITETVGYLLKGINDSPYRLCGAITGGGTGVIGTILSYGGASATVEYLFTPYSLQVSYDYLGFKPDKLCDPASARMYAMKAYHDAMKYSDGPVIGVGATSSLGKIEPERAGREHKIFIAIQTREYTKTIAVYLTGPRTREEEERINENLILNAIAEACGVNYRLLDNLNCDEQLDVRQTGPAPEVIQVAHREIPTLSFSGHTHDDVNLMLPASFNPLHATHLRMAEIAAEMTGKKCHFEMAVRNADKPPLDYTSITDRLDGLQKKDECGGLWITALPTFAEKASHFAPLTFVVGADTVERICDPRFYGSQQSMLDALTGMSAAGTKFLCFARKIGGEVYEAFFCDPPQAFRQMAMVVDSSVFVSDLSSTEIRRNG